MKKTIEKPYITGHEFHVMCVDAGIKKSEIVTNCDRSIVTLNDWIKGGIVTTATIDEFVRAYNKLNTLKQREDNNNDK